MSSEDLTLENLASLTAEELAEVVVNLTVNEYILELTDPLAKRLGVTPEAIKHEQEKGW